MNNTEIIQLAADVGKIILENGGETYRVEQTISIICSSYDLIKTESYVTPTGIIISATDKNNNTTSVIRRIEKRTVNLEKISKINELSRNIYSNKLPLDNVRERLETIKNTPNYSNKTTSVFSAITAGSFTLLFGGCFGDFIVACIIGISINVLSILLNKLKVNSFFINMLGGALAALMALIASNVIIGLDKDKIIIGSIMLLVPGLAITNAIRDTIAGDLVSGVSRIIEAFLIAIAIAVGTGFTFNIWLKFFGGV